MAAKVPLPEFQPLNVVDPSLPTTRSLSLIDYIKQTIRHRKLLISMVIFANLFALISVHLFILKFSRGYPYVPATKQQDTTKSTNLQPTDQTSLYDLINSPNNKAIFSQIKFSDFAFYDNESNVVGTVEFAYFNQYQRQPYVANGYIGSRIPNVGQGFAYDSLSNSPGANEDDLLNGWPLFDKRYAGAFIAGFYDIQVNTTGTNFPELLENGYESVIAAVPQWTTLMLSAEIDGQTYTLDPSLRTDLIGDISNYVQNLSLSNGIVTTQFTWLNALEVRYEILAHRTEVNLGLVNLQVINFGNETIQLDIIDKLDFESAQRSQLTGVNYDDNGIYITFQPSEINYIDGAIYSTLNVDGPISRSSTNDTVSQTSRIFLNEGRTINASKFAGIASTDFDPDHLKSAQDVLSLARQVSQKHHNVNEVVKTHKAGWKDTFQKEPVVTFNSDPLLTLGSRASVFHLLANTRPDAQGVTGALGVGGLSSDSYAGLVFWDADLWMLNAILPFAPSHAKSLVNYRLHTHQQAIENVPQGYQGAVYPWTSGRFGNCTGTGPCLNYEYHINFAVARAAWQLYISGAADDDFLANVAYPLITDAATFFSQYLADYNDTLGRYVTHNLTDPDEYANHVDNGAYTNAGISLVMKWAISVASHLGREFSPLFQNIAGNMFLPTADNSQNITLEYSGMNSSVDVKQADVIMLTFPLENELIDNEQAFTNMEFYSAKQVSYGPAMTFPVFSIVAAVLAPSGCASQSYLQKAIQPYLRGPFAQFSEQNNDDFNINGGTHPAFPFLTAHGGWVQAVLQGLTGFRFDYATDNGSLVRMLRLDPIALPSLGDGVEYKGVNYNNHSLSMSINATHFKVTNEGKTNKNADDSIKILIAERNPMAGVYDLKDGEDLIFPLYTPAYTFANSISECGLANFYNITEGALGDAPISINDGDNTTRWQVQYNDTVGKVLVDLRRFRSVSHILFNWGDRPPQNLSVSKYIGNEFTQATDFFAKVDFGNQLYQNYKYLNPEQKLVKQADVFQQVHSSAVEINAPYDPNEFFEVVVPDRHNTTSLDLDIESRFLLLEVEKIHNTEAIDGDFGGAKFVEVVVYG
ncbi:ATH1 [[Candida] subhashii]|uniref:alpha,alpha-trehalase n=1 Tax=[Candida] subhashii TaxID=561895 RepID=A0A8J5QHY4_9ASCO|nr:ATH1 [[Candida] subhashii]KAG7662364.1 ATH1 [[Candida] subhashii]